MCALFCCAALGAWNGLSEWRAWTDSPFVGLKGSEACLLALRYPAYLVLKQNGFSVELRIGRIKTPDSI